LSPLKIFHRVITTTTITTTTTTTTYYYYYYYDYFLILLSLLIFSTGSKIHAGTWAPFKINFQAPLPAATFRQPSHPFSSDHFENRPAISFLVFQRILSFWDMLKHRLHSSFRRKNCADSGTLSTCPSHRNLPFIISEIIFVSLHISSTS
jgi:hypothetical protein